MDILAEKPDTKRPAIIQAATSLFAQRGVDATSMRDIAEAAGVREAAIYRYFASKDEMSHKIFVSWYGWYSRQLREIVRGPGPPGCSRSFVQANCAADTSGLRLDRITRRKMMKTRLSHTISWAIRVTT